MPPGLVPEIGLVRDSVSESKNYRIRLERLWNPVFLYCPAVCFERINYLLPKP